jgi:predicted O-methyltransferase YrrM
VSEVPSYASSHGLAPAQIAGALREFERLHEQAYPGNVIVTSPNQATVRVAKALLASWRKPNEIYNYVSMHSALVADRLKARTAAYSPIDWSAAIVDLDRLYPGSARFLRDPGLVELEMHVFEKSLALKEGGALMLNFNSDLTLARCLYLICRALTPSVVIETGVAYGMSSAFILHALAVNGRGTLHSIDLPLPGEDFHKLFGALVPETLRDRWQMHLGSSQRELPTMVRIQPVDLFVHDSLHTYKNMRREFEAAWPHIRAGGILLSDDVEGNTAFQELLGQEPRYWQVVRQEHKPDSLFGIAMRH